MALAYLIDPAKQFITKSGTINVAGRLRVYLANTDDAAVTYCDFGGTYNPEVIVLDDNGRATVIADSAKAYRVEVYTRDGMLLWTQEPVWTMATGGGVTGVKVESTDGTVVVNKETVGSTVVYDLSTDVPEETAPFGKSWISAASLADTSDTWTDIPWDGNSGTMLFVGGAWKSEMDAIADLEVDVSVSYDNSHPVSSIFVMMEVTAGSDTITLPVRELDMSMEAPSVHFSCKAPVEPGDAISYRLMYRSTEAVTLGFEARAWLNLEANWANTQVNLDYNELLNLPQINGVTISGNSAGSAYGLVDKTDFDSCCSAMSGAVSSLQTGVNVLSGDVSSLSGDVNAISAVISSITGQTGNYVEVSSISAESAIWNTVSYKVDQSAFDDCCSAMSSNVSAISSDVSSLSGDVTSISSTVSGLTGTYVEISSISAQSSVWNTVTGKQDSGDYAYNSAVSSKVDQSAFDDCCSSMSGAVSSLSSDVSAISGTVSGLTGQYVEISAISTQSSVWNEVTGKQDSGDYLSATESSNYVLTSQSGAFQPSGNYQTAGDYAYNSSVSTKVDQTEFDTCCQTMSGAVSSLASDVSAISGTVSGLTGQYVEISSISGASSVWNSASAVSAIENDITSISSLVSGITGNTGDYVEKSSISAESAIWNSASAVSSKADASSLTGYLALADIHSTTASAITSIGGSAVGGSSNLYTGIYPIVVDNTAGTIGIDNTGLSVDDTMTSYTSAGEVVIGVKPGVYAFESSMSSKLDTSAFSDVSASFLTAETVTATGSDGTYITSINSLPLSGVGGGVTSVVTATAGDGTSVSSVNGMPLLDTGAIRSAGIGDLFVASPLFTGDSAGSAYIGLDLSSNTANEITAIGGSAIAGGGAASLPISGSGDDGYGNSATSTYSETGAEFVMTGSYSGSSYLSPSTLYLVHRQNSFTRPSTLVEANRIQLSDGNDTLLLDVATISGYSDAYTTVYNNSASWGATPVVTATAGDGTSISSVNGMPLLDTSVSSVASSIASAYQVVSSVGSDGSYITSINGSGLSGAGGGITGDYVEKSAINVAVGSSVLAESTGFAQGVRATGRSLGFAWGDDVSANFYAVAFGSLCRAYNGYAFGVGLSARNYVTAFGTYNKYTANSAFVIGDGTGPFKRHDLMVITYDGEITMYSGTADTAGTGILSSIRAISAAATGGGGIDSATCSSIASSYAESAVSSKQDSSGMSAYVEKTAYDNLYSAFTALSDVISTYSSYFSSISAKVDSTAIGVE